MIYGRIIVMSFARLKALRSSAHRVWDPHHEKHETHEKHERSFCFAYFVYFVFSCLSWLSAVRRFLHSRSAKTHSERPEMAVTYCLPSTSYVIGPLTICAPRLAFHKSDPVRASSAWK